MIRTPSPRRVLKILWIILPFLVCLVIMLPRIQSAQFGLFDDGVTITNARNITQGNWSPGWEASTGRFRPVYWLYYALIYALAGADPKAFFVGNMLLFFALTVAVILLARIRGNSWFVAGLAGFLFALVGPTIENFYTLSKGEPLQLLGVLFALILSSKVVEIRPAWLRVIAFLGTVLGLLIAFAVKETTLAVIVLYVGWLVLAWLYRRLGWDRRSLVPYWIGLAAALLSGAAFFIFRSLYAPVGLSGGGYTSGYQLAVGSLVASALRWSGWLLRDYNYLLPILIVVLAWSISKRRFFPSLDDLELLVWMAVWMAIFLPWTFTVEYYMLPFAVGTVLLGSRLVERVVVGPLNGSRNWRCVGAGALMVTGILLLLTLPNNISNGRVQLTMDLANERMLSYLAATVPTGGEVVINMPSDLEFVYEIRLHLNHLYGRPDIQTDRFFFQGHLPGQGLERSYVLITPGIENTPRHSVRVGLYEQGAREWLRTLDDFLGGSPTAVWQDKLEFRSLVIDLPRLFCPLLGERDFCVQPGRVISQELFRYSWRIDSVNQYVLAMSQPAVFQSGMWSLRQLDHQVVFRTFGQAGDLPFSGDWDGDGASDLGVYRPADLTWHLAVNLDGKTEMVFSLPDMQPGDIPLSGDWDGDGRDTPAFYRPDDGSWYFYNSLQESSPDLVVLQAGQPGAQPLVGDWDGDGRDTFGLYHPDSGTVDLENSLEGSLQGIDLALAPNSYLVSGRWGARPGDTLVVWSAGVWTPVMVLCDCKPSNPPKAFNFGDPQDIPIQMMWRAP